MNQDLLFLTNKAHTVIFETISDAPNAAMPDGFKPFDILESYTSEGVQENHLPAIEIYGFWKMEV